MNCMKNKPFVLMTFCHTLFEKCNNQVIFHDIIGTWLNCHTCASGKSWKLKQVYRYLSCVYVLGKTECLKKCLVVLKSFNVYYHTFKVYCTLIKINDRIFNHPYMVRYQNSCMFSLPCQSST